MNPDKPASEHDQKLLRNHPVALSDLQKLLMMARELCTSARSLSEQDDQSNHDEGVAKLAHLAVELVNGLEELIGLQDAPSVDPELSYLPGENRQLAELRKLGGDDFVAELLAEFVVQVESDFAEIDAAARTCRYSEIQRLAHRLKGSSITVGMTEITSICNEVEAHAADQDDGRIRASLERLLRVIDEQRDLVNGNRKSVRILIADDHPVVRFGVRRMLQNHGQYLVVGEASDGKEAIREMREMQPDLLLLDLNMPLLPGLETLRELTTIQVPTKTVLLTSAISPREILEALQLGARGVMLKDALTTDLAECISTVMSGHYWLGSKRVTNLVQVLNDLMEEIKEPPRNTFGLTVRELEIVRLIAQGMTNKDIAQDCKIAEETVKRHLKNIFDKVGVWNRLELALFAINNHLAVEPEATV